VSRPASAPTRNAPGSRETHRSGVASCAIADVVTGPVRPLRVLAVFPAAAYLAHADGIVALVAADGIHHPNAVVVAAATVERPLAGLTAGQRGSIGRGRVEVGDVTVAVARWADPVPRLRRVAPSELADRVEQLRASLHERTGPPPASLAGPAEAVAAALRRRDPAAVVDAARALVGGGPGLTPAGDDVLAGLFAAVVTLVPALAGGGGPGRPARQPAVGTMTEPTIASEVRAPRQPAFGTASEPTSASEARPPCGDGVTGLTVAVEAAAEGIVARARAATTAISAELLRHALRGEVAAPAAAVLHALTGRRQLGPALDELLAVGATSGRDLALGLVTGADLVAHTALVARPLPSTPDTATATTVGGPAGGGLPVAPGPVAVDPVAGNGTATITSIVARSACGPTIPSGDAP
jgi:hypothetical protein